MTGSRGSLAVIGAGLAGLTCAQAIAASMPKSGLFDELVVYDKARGSGGRMSTRRVRLDGVEVTFDHGAQYFTARSEEFRRRVEDWHEKGLVAPWLGEIVDLSFDSISEPAQPSHHVRRTGDEVAWVGTPRMNALLRKLSDGLNEHKEGRVRFSSRVERLERSGSGWRLTLQDGESHEHDTVVLAVPAPQASELLAKGHLFEEALSRVALEPCHALLAAFDGPLEPGFDAAFVQGHPVAAWVARDSSKPGRSTRTADTWVLHTSSAWSQGCLETDLSSLGPRLVEALQDVCQTNHEPQLTQVHRWRYARAVTSLVSGSEAGSLWHPESRLGLCGDWCIAPRVEAAFSSGRSLARRLVEEL